MMESVTGCADTWQPADHSTDAPKHAVLDGRMKAPASSNDDLLAGVVLVAK